MKKIVSLIICLILILTGCVGNRQRIDSTQPTVNTEAEIAKREAAALRAELEIAKKEAELAKREAAIVKEAKKQIEDSKKIKVDSTEEAKPKTEEAKTEEPKVQINSTSKSVETLLKAWSSYSVYKIEDVKPSIEKIEELTEDELKIKLPDNCVYSKIDIINMINSGLGDFRYIAGSEYIKIDEDYEFIADYYKICRLSYYGDNKPRYKVYPCIIAHYYDNEVVIPWQANTCTISFEVADDIKANNPNVIFEDYKESWKEDEAIKGLAMTFNADQKTIKFAPTETYPKAFYKNVK